MNGLNLSLSKFNIYDLLIALLIVGVILSNYIWLKLDEYPVEGHNLLGVKAAVTVYRELRGMDNMYKEYDRILGIYGPMVLYPPLSFLIVVLFYFLFGLQGQMVAMVNSIYIALTLICVYLIGKHIFNKPAGLLAAFILSSFPGFIAFSRVYWIEFGLMGYVCLDLYLLLKTNFFENRKYSILLGISLALSFLHKPESVIFLIGPLLLVIYKSSLLKDIFKAKFLDKAINLILTLTLALILTSFWWIRYGKIYLGRILLVSSLDIDQIYNPLSTFDFLTFYLQSIILLIGRFFVILFFLSVIFLMIRSILKREKRFYILFFLICFLVIYIIFTLSKTKNTPHILSILPTITILITAGIYFIKSKALKFMLVSLILAYCLVLHLNSFYSLEDMHYYPVRAISALSLRTLDFCPSNKQVYNPDPMHPPRKERIEFTMKEILEYIKKDSYGIKYPGIIAVYNNRGFQNTNFEYYNLIGDYNFIFKYFTANELSELDYIIIEKSENESTEEILKRDYDPNDIEVRNFKNIFKDGIRDFVLIKTFKIPNGNSSVFIYKKRSLTVS